MTAPVFVDTDVPLYTRDDTEPAKRPRAQAWTTGMTGPAIH